MGSAKAEGVAPGMPREDAVWGLAGARIGGAVTGGGRAGVLIAGPLGLCFLPAFVLLGVVPVVAGLAGEVFGGLLS